MKSKYLIQIKALGNRYSLRREILKNAGFTIVELMIASLVFSAVLILITYGVISFNNAFYGGVVQSSTQNVARSIIDNISQAIQLDGGTISMKGPVAGWTGICVGNQMYQFRQGKQLYNGSAPGINQVQQALLVTNSVVNCGGQTPGTVPGGTASGTELLGEHMRVANLMVTHLGTTTTLYKINLRIVYGDDELLCSQSLGTCNNPNDPSGATATDAECRSPSGAAQFCAVSDLTTIVEQRVD